MTVDEQGRVEVEHQKRLLKRGCHVLKGGGDRGGENPDRQGDRQASPPLPADRHATGKDAPGVPLGGREEPAATPRPALRAQGHASGIVSNQATASRVVSG